MKTCIYIGLLVLTACSGSTEGREAPADPYAPIPIAGSRCGAVVQQHVIAPTSHVPECSPVSYPTNPPASGDHYGTWAGYGAYAAPLARGFWVHNLEHGSVVVTYKCFVDNCTADLQAVEAWLE